MAAPKTFEMEMHVRDLSNLAWTRLSTLMDEGLAQQEPDGEDVSEAELMLQFKRAVAERADFLMIRLRRDE